MKILFVLLLSINIFAFDGASASKIFDKIFHAMIDKEVILVYTSNEVYKEVIINAENLSLSKVFKEADIILVDSLKEIPKGSEDGLFFTTSYPVLRENDNVVGAFYWDKGHIKIEFLEKRLLKKEISLPDSFSKYIKESL